MMIQNNMYHTPKSSERLSKVSKVDLDTSRLHENARNLILGSNSEGNFISTFMSAKLNQILQILPLLIFSC